MKKIITVFGALTVASTPTIALQRITMHKTQNLQNVITKISNSENNNITVINDSDYFFNFNVYLTSSDYNGFSGFLDQIVFKLSDYNYHAWPIYLFQWLDDDDFHSGPMPELKQHTAQGYFHDPITWSSRLEEHMGDFGSWTDDKSDTAYHMSINYGKWGSFGQTVDNEWNADRAASKPLIGINFKFMFAYDFLVRDQYETFPPSFKIIMS